MRVFLSVVVSSQLNILVRGQNPDSGGEVLQGLSTGTLLYVVFFKVIEKEQLKGTSWIVQARKR